MTPPTYPLGTSWCTAHEPADATDDYAECVRVVGTVVLDQGAMTSGFRIDPADGVDQEVVITVRQLEGDPPMVDVDWPDSTVDFPGLDTWTPREARLIGGYLLEAADILAGPA